jgi:hypothetical protein
VSPTWGDHVTPPLSFDISPGQKHQPPTLSSEVFSLKDSIPCFMSNSSLPYAFLFLTGFLVIGMNAGELGSFVRV